MKEPVFLPAGPPLLQDFLSAVCPSLTAVGGVAQETLGQEKLVGSRQACLKFITFQAALGGGGVEVLCTRTRVSL